MPITLYKRTRLGSVAGSGNERRGHGNTRPCIHESYVRGMRDRETSLENRNAIPLRTIGLDGEKISLDVDIEAFGNALYDPGRRAPMRKSTPQEADFVTFRDRCSPLRQLSEQFVPRVRTFLAISKRRWKKLPARVYRGLSVPFSVRDRNENRWSSTARRWKKKESRLRSRGIPVTLSRDFDASRPRWYPYPCIEVNGVSTLRSRLRGGQKLAAGIARNFSGRYLRDYKKRGNDDRSRSTLAQVYR